MTWTDETVEAVLKLWQEGETASAIARILGNGVTRAAVIGKVHRMSAVRRGPGVLRAPARKQRAKMQQKKEPAPEPVAVLVNGKHVTLETLGGRMCKWPHGDPREKDFHFCGHPVHLDGPYCAYHLAKSLYAGAVPSPDEVRAKSRETALATGIARVFG